MALDTLMYVFVAGVFVYIVLVLIAVWTIWK